MAIEWGRTYSGNFGSDTTGYLNEESRVRITQSVERTVITIEVSPDELELSAVKAAIEALFAQIEAARKGVA
jgi:hypothetical protein